MVSNFKKILSIVFALIVLLSGLVRFNQSQNFDFPFTFDQARDMLDIRVLGNFKDFAVSGPTTSITGLNLGPYYYIFSLPAYWIGNGNPQGLIYWNNLWFLLSGLFIYLFFYKRNQTLGFFISAIFLMSPQLFSITRYFWNAHSVVYFIVFYFLSLWNYYEKKDAKSALLLGITSGLVIQFEAAFGSMCVVFSFLLILIGRDRKSIKNYLVGLLPWFSPQILFEIKNNFQMTKLFIGIFTGSNPVLGVKVPLQGVMSLHFHTFLKFFEGQFMAPYGLGFIILIVSIGAGLLNQKYKKYVLLYLAFIVFAYLYFTTIYHHELKPWYLEGIRVWYCFIVGIGLASLIKFNKLFILLITLLLACSFYLTAVDQKVYIADNGTSNDPKNASNIIKTLDWIYMKANGEGFKAYNYVPEVYDYSPYYFYVWYGTKTYGYAPTEISYSLSPVPEYVRSESKFKRVTRPGESIAIIYETNGDYKTWLRQFGNYCITDSQMFNWHVVAEWRTKC